MKTQGLLSIIAAAVVSLALSQTALAQVRGSQGGYSGGINGPTVSPYLNMFQANSQGLIPYQELVRPQIETQNALRNQAGAIQNLQQQQQSSSQGRGGSRSTGHSTAFMNYSHFYHVPNSQRPR
jgi:hypothetical protein